MLHPSTKTNAPALTISVVGSISSRNDPSIHLDTDNP